MRVARRSSGLEKRHGEGEVGTVEERGAVVGKRKRSADSSKSADEEDAVVDEHVEGDDVGSTQSGATAVRCQPGPSELRSAPAATTNL